MLQSCTLTQASTPWRDVDSVNSSEFLVDFPSLGIAVQILTDRGVFLQTQEQIWYYSSLFPAQTSPWLLVWAGSACVWFASDKVDGAARTVWVPPLRRRRLASLESPEQGEGGCCHFLWLLSDDCVSVKQRECEIVSVHVCLFACVLPCVGVT